MTEQWLDKVNQEDENTEYAYELEELLAQKMKNQENLANNANHHHNNPNQFNLEQSFGVVPALPSFNMHKMSNTKNIIRSNGFHIENSTQSTVLKNSK